MRIRLDVDYISSYVFWPIYRPDMRLLALEMMPRFNSGDGALSIHKEILVPQLSVEQKQTMLLEQLSFIKSNADWFIRNQIILVIKVDQDRVRRIIRDEALRTDINNAPFIQFEINENFPNLSLGKENKNLATLSRYFTLWLDNLGSGKSNLKALYDNLFGYVKIDQNLVREIFSIPSRAAMSDALLRQIKSDNCSVIAKGIDSDEYLARSQQLGVDALQGSLWPPVGLEALDSLLIGDVRT
ncbi:EAL domain-containing protein [Affinibrenneria salicis]|uniref:EAL domain-containing protein n=1 Tax=Affinibrenneria salicis TaxID=2590031 RepID=A0A5J5G357_9GAMM|nr:EAL domain-containing protein [Affinibrenneria salicis]KAA9001226.1 EAL domain-containing protein [Affinibrenneria salicis]